MKASRDPKDKERYDTLCDVNLSCAAAVDILNDLLCYEKLESGILDLHRESVLVLSFLGDCVSMFSAQARECDVSLSLISTEPEERLHYEYALQQHDTFYVDKFKMDQVIRNLISNALKFTARKGSVTVKANFHADVIGDDICISDSSDLDDSNPSQSHSANLSG